MLKSCFSSTDARPDGKAVKGRAMSNQLQLEKSPDLLQRWVNPVD